MSQTLAATAEADSVRLRRLVLRDFRSYPALDLALTERTVVVTGENGSGKTNLLEAVSMLAQGRGLRRAELAACARDGGGGGFTVSAELCGGDGSRQLGTAFEPQAPTTRRFRLDREPVGSARAFADHLRLVWLTPAMDGLFAGSPGERRRFLDRLVLAVDTEHGGRVAALERALRGRNHLLADNAERAWLDALEREMAELAVAVGAARGETVSRLAALIGGEAATGPFPWAEVALEGEFEAMCAGRAALEAEDRYRAALRDGRARDAAAGRTLVGPQATDLRVKYGPKGVAAALCSTGEQKALLVGLVVAHARLVTAISGHAPVMLLDEIAAHFDEARRAALFEVLADLPGQVWLSGADAGAFATMRQAAQRLLVEPGRVLPG